MRARVRASKELRHEAADHVFVLLDHERGLGASKELRHEAADHVVRAEFGRPAYDMLQRSYGMKPQITTRALTSRQSSTRFKGAAA